jgi:hypothetical protein
MLAAVLRLCAVAATHCMFCRTAAAFSCTVLRSRAPGGGIRASSQLRLQRHSMTTAMTASTTHAVYAEGQDMGELFELYAAPEQIGIQKGPPTTLKVNKPRQAVHRDGDWHRAVHIWLINSKGELVLQKRSKFKDTFPGIAGVPLVLVGLLQYYCAVLHDGCASVVQLLIIASAACQADHVCYYVITTGYWDVSVGGHMTAGDDSLVTATKETGEELGIEVKPEQFEVTCLVIVCMYLY